MKKKAVIISASAAAVVIAAALAVFFFIFGLNKAASMWLVKTIGDVRVSDDEGGDVEIIDRLGLYSGYRVKTADQSYGWIDLDDVKLTKLDEDSSVDINKSGKVLEIVLRGGAIFFNVTKPLEEDEELTIRSSTTVTAIRGTCGWVSVSDDDSVDVYIIEGKVRCTVTGDDGSKSAETVTAGNCAHMSTVSGGAELTLEQFGEEDIPKFVSDEAKERDDVREDLGNIGIDIESGAPSYENDDGGDTADTDAADTSGTDTAPTTTPVPDTDSSAPVDGVVEGNHDPDILGPIYLGDANATTMTSEQVAVLADKISNYIESLEAIYESRRDALPLSGISCSAALFDAGNGVPGLFLAGGGLFGDDSTVMDLSQFGDAYELEPGLWYFDGGELKRFEPNADYPIFEVKVFETYVFAGGSSEAGYAGGVFEFDNGVILPDSSYSASIGLNGEDPTVNGAPATAALVDEWRSRWDGANMCGYSHGNDIGVHCFGPDAYEVLEALNAWIGTSAGADDTHDTIDRGDDYVTYTTDTHYEHNPSVSPYVYSAVEYPIFSGTSPAVPVLNEQFRFLDQYFFYENPMMDTFVSSVNGKAAVGETYECSCICEVTRNEGKYVCVSMTTSYDDHTLIPYSHRQNYIYSRDTGEVVPLSAFLEGTDDEIKQAVYDKLIETYGTGTIFDFDKVFDYDVEDFNFEITDEGLVIYFGIGEIGPNMAGPAKIVFDIDV